MKAPVVCQDCGTALAGDGPDTSYCPVCILRQGLLSTAGSFPRVAPAEPPPRFFGQYELLEEIGRGGMGVVYKARQRNLNRTVAIKLLVSGAYSSETLLHRFQTEAESAAGLQHPGIVAIHECGECDNQPYYAMEFVDGLNLAELTGGQPLPAPRAAAYLRAIAEAVHYAHSRGILHRDLKPSNVLIDADDRPRITDFGLAKRLEGGSDVTIAGQMLGSPNYSSPEQAAGRPEQVAVASDVYSLGALLYHVLTGRPPFLAGTMPETIRLVQESDPIAPRALNPAVPSDLDTICLKCLEKDPGRRYPSAQALADELQRFLQGEPIQARAITALERGWRWCRRHPAPAALAGTVLLALTATSLIFYSTARQVEQARALEESARRQAERNLYAADMQIVSRAFTTVTGGGPVDLRASLDASRPKPGEVDLRGFEWRYFWNQLQSQAIATLSGHGHHVVRVTYSADGSLVASLGADGRVRIWDPTAARSIQELEGANPRGLLTFVGRSLVFSQADHSLWEIEPGHPAARRLRAPGLPAVGLLAGGREAVVIGPDGLPRRQPVAPASPPPSATLTPVETPDVIAAMNANGRNAVVTGKVHAGRIHLVDLAENKILLSIEAGDRPIIALAVDPAGRQVAATTFGGTLRIWELARGTLVHESRPFLDPIWGLAFSPDGTTFAAGGNNRQVKVWDTAAWTEIETLRGHNSTVTSLAFHPDGRHLASGSEDELVMLWEARRRTSPHEVRQLLRGAHWTERTPNLAFSPDSHRFAGTAADGTVKVWDAATLEVLGVMKVEARTVAFSADGAYVLTEGFGDVRQRWTLAGEPLETAETGAVRYGNWLTDPLTPRERVALFAQRAAFPSACVLCEIPNARDSIVAASPAASQVVAVSADGATMFIGLPNGRVEVWDVARQQPRYVIPAHKVNVTSVAVSPDGKHFATGGLDNATRLWRTADGGQVATFYAHNRPVWALAFSPDGRTLAAGSCDKEIILCSLDLLQHVASLPLYTVEPKDYEQEVRLLRFSPDGNTLAAGLGDGTLRLFRAAPLSVTDRAGPVL